MCGIYGEYFNTLQLSQKEDFLKRNELNSYRGPDMTGYWSDSSKCQLGFKRLSVLDLSPEGNQPMYSYNKKFIIVFNGEIYNYSLIKKQLLKKNIPFKTTTDTEVLVNYIATYGLDVTLDKIDGMYAFAVYDIENKALHLARDFAGIKPLFYSFKDGNVVFGSRYDLVSKHKLNKSNKIDNKVLKLYLKRHYIPAPYAILEDTYQLEPGEVISFTSSKEITKKKYWSFPNLSDKELVKDSVESIELTSKTLSESVADEMIADVPLGSFLSGGIDSPIITYIAKQQKRDIQSFTIGSDSIVHDESELATQYAKAIGVNLELTTMNAKSALEILDDCFEHLKEPFADFSMIPTYLVNKNAKEKCTVMLSGDGGDELFFGYERFDSIYKNKKWIFIPKAFRYLCYGIDKVLWNNKHLNSAILKQNLSSAHLGLGSRFNDKLIVSLFPKLQEVKDTKLNYYEYEDSLSDTEFLNAMRKAEYYDMMQKTLVKVDRMSMANSVEVRVPFLKKSVIENVVKISPRIAFKENNPKYILKHILGLFIPGAPYSNKKKGFTIPLAKWLREDLKEPFEQILFNSNFIIDFNISEKALVKLWNEHQSGEKNYKWEIFTLYSLAKWKISQDV